MEQSRQGGEPDCQRRTRLAYSLGARWIGLIAAMTLLGTATVAGVPAPASTDAGAGEYTLVDLGTLPGGSSSAAYDINDAGQVVGESNSADGPTLHAALWQGGTVTELGHRGGPTNSSVALAINNAGQIVGYGRVPYSPNQRGLLWVSGTMTDLPMAQAYGINEKVQVSGGTNPSPSSAALLWEHGVTTDLGVYGGQAYDINNHRQVVGKYRACCYSVHAFVWENGTATDLGPGVAQGINDLGQIVGGSTLWENGTTTYLGTLGGSYTVAYKINNHAQVVGTSTNVSGSWHAFLWEGGAMGDLGTLPGGSESTAYGVNDYGDVVGSSRDAAGALHAVLWMAGTHDVAVSSASADPAIAWVGTPVTVTATVQNQGSRPETFEVRAFADDLLVGTQTVSDLAPGSPETVSFVWDTSGAGSGIYKIVVQAVPVPGETDLEDNEQSAGAVVLLPPLFDPGLPPS